MKFKFDYLYPITLLIFIIILIKDKASIKTTLGFCFTLAIVFVFQRIYYHIFDKNMAELFKQAQKTINKKHEESTNKATIRCKEPLSLVSQSHEEIKILDDLIEHAGIYYSKYKDNYNLYNELIDEECKRYINVFIKLIADKPEIYNQIIKKRPSLKNYIITSTNDSINNAPSLEEVRNYMIEIKNKYGNALVATIAINKFGFCKELFTVSNEFGGEVISFALFSYNSKIKDGQNRFIFGNIDYTKLKNDVGFSFEKISSDSKEKVKEFVKSLGIEKIDFFSNRWVVDKKNQIYIINIHGVEFRDNSHFGVYVLKYKTSAVRFEATYSVENISNDKYIINWKVNKFQIPHELKDDAEIIRALATKTFSMFNLNIKKSKEESVIDFCCSIEFKDDFLQDEENSIKHEQYLKDEMRKDPEYIKSCENNAILFKLPPKERLVQEIKDLSFPDAIFAVELYNYRHSDRFSNPSRNTLKAEEAVDLFEVFNDKNPEEVKRWASLSYQLLKDSKSDVCESCMNNIYDDGYYQFYRNDLDKLMAKYPGFSDNTYQTAINENLRYYR